MSLIGNVTGFVSDLSSFTAASEMPAPPLSIGLGGTGSGSSLLEPWASQAVGSGTDFLGGISRFGKTGNPSPWALTSDAELVQPTKWSTSTLGSIGSAPLLSFDAEPGLTPQQNALIRSEGVAVWDHQGVDSLASNWLKTIASVGQAQAGKNSFLQTTGSMRDVKSALDFTGEPGIGVLSPENYRPLLNSAQKFSYGILKKLESDTNSLVGEITINPVYTEKGIRQLDEHIRTNYLDYFSESAKKLKPASSVVALQDEFEFWPGADGAAFGRMVPASLFKDRSIELGTNRRVTGLFTGQNLTSSVPAHEIFHYYAPDFSDEISARPLIDIYNPWTNKSIIQLPVDHFPDKKLITDVSEGLTEHYAGKVTGFQLESEWPGAPYAKPKLVMDWAEKFFGPEMLAKAYFQGDRSSITQLYNWASDKLGSAK